MLQLCQGAYAMFLSSAGKGATEESETARWRVGGKTAEAGGDGDGVEWG